MFADAILCSNIGPQKSMRNSSLYKLNKKITVIRMTKKRFCKETRLLIDFKIIDINITKQKKVR